MTTLPPVPPESKDWTWVLGEACPDCGFDTRAPRRDDLSALAAGVGERWTQALGGHPDVRARPEPQTWSALEYACHVRDVFALARYRHGLMLTEDDPLFANWDQDATAVDEDYAGQDPSAVEAALAANAAAYAGDLAAVTEDEWHRPGRRSDDKAFTVESFARYLLHDPIHHLTDVTGQRWSDSP
jgi:hypothetical protein